MELSIAPQSYQPSSEALVRAIYNAATLMAGTAAQESTVDGVSGVSAYMCPSRPGVRSLNFAMSVDLALPQTDATPESATSLIQNVQDHFKKQESQCEVMYASQSQWPASLADEAVAAGFEAVTRKVFMLQNYKQPASGSGSLQVVPARALYGQLESFYKQWATIEMHADQKLASDLALTMIDFLEEPKLELLIAREHGKNIACAGVISLGQIGVIVPAWCDPQARGRGVAKELMSHVLAYCGRALFNQVVIDRSEHCVAIPFYESIGFTHVASFVKYRRVNSD